MANRDILLTIIVLLGIAWLFFANYNKSPQPEVRAPSAIERVQQPATVDRTPAPVKSP